MRLWHKNIQVTMSLKFYLNDFTMSKSRHLIVSGENANILNYKVITLTMADNSIETSFQIDNHCINMWALCD